MCHPIHGKILPWIQTDILTLAGIQTFLAGILQGQAFHKAGLLPSLKHDDGDISCINWSPGSGHITLLLVLHFAVCAA